MSDLTSLTDEQRDEEFNALSTDDCGHLAAFVSSQFPEIFDQAVAALKSYKGSHLEATR
jgi:hypothetical protein